MKRFIAGTTVAAMVAAGAGVAAAHDGDERSGRERPGAATTDGARHVGFGGLRGFAEELGLDPAELRAQLAAGSTIAEIAEQQGVDLEAVIEALLDDVEQRLRALTTRTFDEQPDDAPSQRPRSPRGPGRSFEDPPRGD